MTTADIGIGGQVEQIKHQPAQAVSHIYNQKIPQQRKKVAGMYFLKQFSHYK